MKHGCLFAWLHTRRDATGYKILTAQSRQKRSPSVKVAIVYTYTNAYARVLAHIYVCKFVSPLTLPFPPPRHINPASCLLAYLLAYLIACLLTCLPTCLSWSILVYLPQPTYLPICRSNRLLVYLFVYLSFIHLSICLSIYLSISLLACLPGCCLLARQPLFASPFVQYRYHNNGNIAIPTTYFTMTLVTTRHDLTIRLIQMYL